MSSEKTDSLTSPQNIQDIDINKLLILEKIASNLSDQLNFDVLYILDYMITNGDKAVEMFTEIFLHMQKNRIHFLNEQQLEDYTNKYNLPVLKQIEFNEAKILEMRDKLIEAHTRQKEIEQPMIVTSINGVIKSVSAVLISFISFKILKVLFNSLLSHTKYANNPYLSSLLSITLIATVITIIVKFGFDKINKQPKTQVVSKR